MKNIVFAQVGWEEYLYWQTQDKKTLKKINNLLKSIVRDGPLQGEGKPESLKESNGNYSRRINEKDRLVYTVSDEAVTVISCKGHYED